MKETRRDLVSPIPIHTFVEMASAPFLAALVESAVGQNDAGSSRVQADPPVRVLGGVDAKTAASWQEVTVDFLSDLEW